MLLVTYGSEVRLVKCRYSLAQRCVCRIARKYNAFRPSEKAQTEFSQTLVYEINHSGPWNNGRLAAFGHAVAGQSVSSQIWTFSISGVLIAMSSSLPTGSLHVSGQDRPAMQTQPPAVRQARWAVRCSGFRRSSGPVASLLHICWGHP